MVDRIKALCRSKGTSVTKLEALLGFGNGTIGKWRNAKNSPSTDKIKLVADELGVSVQYLLTGEEANNNPAPEIRNGAEEEFVKLFEQLPRETQERELAYLRELVEKMKQDG